MAWVRIDDQVPHHRKFLEAGAAASWLWVCGIAYSQRQLTNGFIPRKALVTLGVSSPRALAERLVSSHLWEARDGGFQIHDYLDYNMTREEALAHQAKQHENKVKAGKAGGHAAARSRRLAGGQQPAVAELQQPGLQQNHSPIPSHPKDLSPQPPSGEGGARRTGRKPTRKEREEAELIHRRTGGYCAHEPTCGSHDECIGRLIGDRRGKLEEQLA